MAHVVMNVLSLSVSVTRALLTAAQRHRNAHRCGAGGRLATAISDRAMRRRTGARRETQEPKILPGGLLAASAVFAVLAGTLEVACGGGPGRWLGEMARAVDFSGLTANFTINGVDDLADLLDACAVLEKTDTTIAEKDGFLCEEYETETPDGYIITMHRIPGGSCMNKTKKPVLLVHGLLGSSADWLLLGKNSALAYLLAECCRDVWMMDMRGNTYSRKHRYLNTSDPQYWDWTYHEIAVFDVPTVIDYILEKTNQTQVVYVGYSLGNTVGLVMCSLLPWYNEKIAKFIALAPVASLENTKSIIGIFAYFTDQLADLLNSWGEYAFLTRTHGLDKSLKLICAGGTLTGACDLFLFAIMGYDPAQLTRNMTKMYLSHNPAGTSTKTMRHLAVSVTNGTFAQYNYGESENLRRYNSTSPPDYPLEKITVCTYFIFGENDILSTPEDVLKLYCKLIDQKSLIKVDYSQFTHMDFTTAKDARGLVYDTVLEIISDEGHLKTDKCK